MTLAPRIEVYTQLACRALHESSGGIPDTNSPVSDAYTNSNRTISAEHASDNVHVSFPDIAVLKDACSADPKVQARAARIQASVKTTESILSAVTTGWLSHLGDLYGRKRILSVSVFGALFMDFIYILVSGSDSFFSRHGEAFIIAAPMVEGFLGAQSTYNGITHAYATDCTPDGSRAKIFSTMQGMLYVGLASGPWLNGLVLNLVPHTNTTSLFVLAIIIALSNLIFVTIILPESLPSDRRLKPSSTPHVPGKRVSRAIKAVVRQFTRPISVFAPQKLDGGRRGYDWNLTLTGAALFIYVLSIQVYNLKYLYVKHVYDWTGEQLGYYMSFLWITRAVFLLLLLPALLTYFAPNRTRPSLRSSPAALAAAMRFDRRIAAISFFTDASANALVTIAPTSSQALFIFFTSLNSLTSGGNPALHSLGAVSLQAMGKGGELGLVFGALGVVNAVAHIIAPGIYAAIYGATVAEFPKAIFLMSAVLLYIVFSLLMGIRPNINLRAPEAETGTAESALDNEQDESAIVNGEDEDTNREGEDRWRASARRSDTQDIEDVRRMSVVRASVSSDTL
ncbi:hypothetical protein BV25DRAFT_1879320 [Artomyces pyxidatus]|uniref:Uncharacterized protein n=1 Tax=Artomyces pyxidatus TaxID=48021 RepID=A0ACB8TBQ7_9AGAM|nr:hypothetical protein BV25DRAFT_1879320 [Artomyces pyxidatus]